MDNLPTRAEPPAELLAQLRRHPMAPLDQNPAAVYVARLASPASRETARNALNLIARLVTGDRLDARQLEWSRLRYQHTAAVRSELIGRYAPATVNKCLSMLKGTLGEAWRLGQLSADDYYRAADLPAVRGKTLPRGRALAKAEIRRLFDSCRADPKPLRGRRDAAAMALMYGAGLRREEAVQLDVQAFDAEDRSVVVRGKGNAQRLAFLPAGAARAVAAWLEIRGTAPGPLLTPFDRRGTRIGPLDPQALYFGMLRRARRARIGRFTPHDLRRSFVTHLLEAGADLGTARRLAGHASVQTTMIYDRRGDDVAREAVELLDGSF